MPTLEEVAEEIRIANRKINRTWKYKYGGRSNLPLRIRKLSNYTSKELLGELGRRRHKVLKDKAPEVLVEREWKRKATTKVRKENCDHAKLAPKLRASGKLAGKWACPSCMKEVPAPTP